MEVSCGGASRRLLKNEVPDAKAAGRDLAGVTCRCRTRGLTDVNVEFEI